MKTKRVANHKREQGTHKSTYFLNLRHLCGGMSVESPPPDCGVKSVLSGIGVTSGFTRMGARPRFTPLRCSSSLESDDGGGVGAFPFPFRVGNQLGPDAVAYR